MNESRADAMRLVQQAGFAVDDIVLFLDTHPNDREALEMYQEYRRILKQAECNYNTNFGPLTIEDVDSDEYWTWVQTPWPWEGEC